MAAVMSFSVPLPRTAVTVVHGSTEVFGGAERSAASGGHRPTRGMRRTARRRIDVVRGQFAGADGDRADISSVQRPLEAGDMVGVRVAEDQ